MLPCFALPSFALRASEGERAYEGKPSEAREPRAKEGQRIRDFS